jgi:hypothetical protein
MSKVKITPSQAIDELMKVRKEHLEKLACAFIKEVGSSKASEYALIEERDGNTWKWYFERRTNARVAVAEEHH